MTNLELSDSPLTFIMDPSIKSMDIENLEYLFGPLSLCQKLLFKINLIF
jgi:hypothetical protein